MHKPNPEPEFEFECYDVNGNFIPENELFPLSESTLDFIAKVFAEQIRENSISDK